MKNKKVTEKEIEDFIINNDISIYNTYDYNYVFPEKKECPKDECSPVVTMEGEIICNHCWKEFGEGSHGIKSLRKVLNNQYGEFGVEKLEQLKLIKESVKNRKTDKLKLVMHTYHNFIYPGDVYTIHYYEL